MAKFDFSANIKGLAEKSVQQMYEVKNLDIAKILPHPDNFYSLSDIELLMEDIARQGLNQPLVVVKNEDDTYTVISGHRRLEAIKRLCAENKYIDRVPCNIRRAYKDKDAEMLDLIQCNEQTRVTSDGEKMKAYELTRQILERQKTDGKLTGRLREHIARQLNMSDAQAKKIEHIRNNAIEEVREAVTNGEMTIYTADEIAKLSEDEQKELLSETNAETITPKDVKQLSKMKKEKCGTRTTDYDEMVTENEEEKCGTRTTDYDETVTESEEELNKKDKTIKFDAWDCLRWYLERHEDDFKTACKNLKGYTEERAVAVFSYIMKQSTL